ncbi:MAG: response regulator transcription factor [Paracoccaceae bacterium]
MNTRSTMAGRSPAIPTNTQATVPSVAFIGSFFNFSDHALRLIEIEFDKISLFRVESIAELERLDKEQREALRLVIVADNFAEDLLSNLERYKSAAGPADLVLAYMDAKIAGRVMAQSLAHGNRNAIRFLPMKASIEVWLSVFRLLLFKEPFIPEELVVDIVGTPQANGGLQSHMGHATQVPPPKQKLTPREMQVLGLVADGRRNKGIARELGLSEHTVKLHIHHVFSKLGVKNRTGASKWFLSQPSLAAQHTPSVE